MTKKELKAYRKAELDQAKSTELKMVIEILGGNRCGQALELNGQTFPFEVILANPILPYKLCKRVGGCVCNYLFIPQRDEDGRLIRQQY